MDFLLQALLGVAHSHSLLSHLLSDIYIYICLFLYSPKYT